MSDELFDAMQATFPAFEELHKPMAQRYSMLQREQAQKLGKDRLEPGDEGYWKLAEDYRKEYHALRKSLALDEKGRRKTEAKIAEAEARGEEPQVVVMKSDKCPKCDGPMTKKAGRGRPPKFCLKCRGLA